MAISRVSLNPAVEQTFVALTAVASVGVPTKAEFDAVVTQVNALRTALINAGVLAAS